ncbi:MAG TPA: hypothetical protein VE077_18305 [Candidatus Methylomirabilis sp.]|nr:hypothetical protein [Candidatus Methylomirabilis sp.]
MPDTQLTSAIAQKKSSAASQARSLRYNALMANPNPLAGVVPQVVHPVNAGETFIAEYIEKIEGEVALDTYVKAQTSAPEVVKRITELENSLQRLASAAMKLLNDENQGENHEDALAELRAAAEQAKFVLKSRLEIDESKHRFRTELARIIEEPPSILNP